ncbi:hypothetical protein B0O99DRAFT_664703 [Bisporella sp. PMI_857]|nr:hypothetical protein B0O99DRAFT_664703 [Bisporella sp. PMI_857]
MASHQADGEPVACRLPTTKITVPVVTRKTLLSWTLEGRRAGKNFVLVDLRRSDYEGDTIRGLVNLPAQSLHFTIPALYSLCSTTNIRTVIWYCSSSRGRGSRAASCCAPKNGIKGWATVGGEYVRMMDGYDASVWK